MEFEYAGGGLGKGGAASLFIDGKKTGEGQIGATAAMVFSADDGCDVGEDTGAPVSPDYGPRGNEFNGDGEGRAACDRQRIARGGPPCGPRGRDAPGDGAPMNSRARRR